jgi:cellulose synthase/poly-beta-1,6-N-acetylglucosamine synthase-like glycosyltransferase
MKPVGIIVLMPTRGAVANETFLCLRERLDGYPHLLKTVFRKDVVTARNQLAKEAREIDTGKLDFEPKYVLCIDDDMWWPKGHVDRAIRILEDNPDVDMVCGRVSRRQPFGPTLAFARPEAPTTVAELGESWYEPEQYADGELTPIWFGSLAWALMRRDCLDRVGDAPFRPIRCDTVFPTDPESGGEFMPEDYSFFSRAIAAGAKIVIERTLLIGHVDATGGNMYFPNTMPRRARGLSVPTEVGDPSLVSAPRAYFEPPGVAA